MKNKDFRIKKDSRPIDFRDPLLDGRKKSKLKPPPKDKYRIRGHESNDEDDD